MKLAEMEKFVGDTPAISYVGIRGDEDREGGLRLFGKAGESQTCKK